MKVKLIRDKLVGIIDPGRISQFDTSTESGRALKLKLLEEKLLEEYHEFIIADTDEEALAEIIDIIEVVEEYAESLGMNLVELWDLKNKKLMEKGGFKDGITLYID